MEVVVTGPNPGSQATDKNAPLIAPDALLAGPPGPEGRRGVPNLGVAAHAVLLPVLLLQACARELAGLAVNVKAPIAGEGHLEALTQLLHEGLCGKWAWQQLHNVTVTTRNACNNM